MRVRLRTAMSPRTGLIRPSRICRSVDFPAPLGPINPIRSPSDTVNEMFSNSEVSPNDLEICCALISGGIQPALYWLDATIHCSVGRRGEQATNAWCQRPLICADSFLCSSLASAYRLPSDKAPHLCPVRRAHTR